MPGDWMDGWEVIDATYPGGSLVDNGRRKGVFHSTEGPSIEAAVSAYQTNTGWPNATVDPYKLRRVQHYPIGVTSRGLEHPAGTPPTNNAVIFQIEIVGTALAPEDCTDAMRPFALASLTPAQLEWLATEVIVPVSDACGIPVALGVDVSVGAPRMTTDAFALYSGWLTHSVAPSQPGGHWDPGHLDVPALIRAAQTPDQEDDMSPAAEKAIIEGAVLQAYTNAGKKADADGVNYWVGEILAGRASVANVVATLNK